MMRNALQFVIRRSGTLAFFFLLFALLIAGPVGESLWQGSGLHGYVVHQNKANGSYSVSAWQSFVQMLVCLGLALLFGLTALRSGSTRLWFGMGTIGVGKTEATKPCVRHNVIRPKRKRVKRH